MAGFEKRSEKIVIYYYRLPLHFYYSSTSAHQSKQISQPSNTDVVTFMSIHVKVVISFALSYANIPSVEASVAPEQKLALEATYSNTTEQTN